MFFAPLFTMFLVKPILSSYFRRLLVTIPSVETAKRYIDTFFSFQLFLICRAKLSNFVIFFYLGVGKVIGQGHSSIYYCHQENGRESI